MILIHYRDFDVLFLKILVVDVAETEALIPFGVQTLVYTARLLSVGQALMVLSLAMTVFCRLLILMFLDLWLVYILASSTKLDYAVCISSFSRTVHYRQIARFY